MSINRREFIIVGGVGTIGSFATIGCPSGETDTRQVPRTRLTAVFSGLIAMVTSNNGTDFVMVDGDATMSGTHAARLLAPQGSVGPNSLPPTGTDAESGRLFWDLKNHRVTLTSGVTSGTTRAGGRTPAEVEKPNPATPNSHKDVSWVAQMSKIPGAGTGKIDPVCLADDPRPKVASRVRFNGGEISSRFSPKFIGTVWQIGPAGPPPPFKQALSELSIFQEIEQGQVSFRLNPFDSGQPQPQDIVLVPTTGVNLDIEFANLPSPAVKCTDSKQTANLAHFAAYYQLLNPPLTTGPIPSCEGLPNCPICPAAGEFIYCPPAQFEP